MSSPIADLFATLRVDDSKLGPEIERAGGRAADSFGSRFRTAVMGPAFSAGLGAGVGVAAFQLLGGAVSTLSSTLSDAVQKAVADEAAVRKLSQTISENVPAWDGNTDAVDRFIRKSEELAFSDDQTRESIGQLVVATGDVRKAMDLSRTAMDLARLKNIDLSEATAVVTKAYAGNIGALRRILPWIDKNADSTEALAAIQKAAEGQAQSYADTTQGQLVRAQIALDEALESLGRSAMPLVSGAAQGLATQLRWVSRFIDDVNGGLRDLGGLIPGTSRDFDLLGESLKALPGLGSWIVANELRDKLEEQADAALASADAIATAKDSLSEFTTAAKEAADEVPEAIQLGVDRSVVIAAQLPADLASALREKRRTWQDALELLAQDLEDEMTRAQEIAYLEGALISENLKRGLVSSDPIVRAQAEATAKLIVDRLEELQHLSMGWGESTGNAYADGLEQSKLRVQRAAKGVAGVVRTVFEAYSPPGPESPLHEIDVWGYRTGEAWATGLAEGLVDGKGKAVSALAGRFTATVPTGYVGMLSPTPPATAAGGGLAPAIIRLEIGGRPLVDYIDEQLAYRPRR